MGMMRQGSTPRLVAEDLHLSLDFVDMVIEDAVTDGALIIVPYTKGSCGSSLCDPDPKSLVCAGCPVMSGAQHRKHPLQTVINTLSKKLHTHHSRP